MACDPCGSDLIDKFIVAEGIKDKHKDALLNKLKVIFICPGIGLERKQFLERKNEIFFLPISFIICFWVLKRTVSLRRFFWVPKTYVLVEK